MPKPSPIEGTTTIADRSIALWIGATWPRKRTESAIPSSRVSARSAGSSGPRPAMSSSRPGTSFFAAANARSRTMCPLIGISRPTQRRRGTSSTYGFGSPLGVIP